MASMPAHVRRVVTGHDTRGEVAIASDGAPPVMRCFTEKGFTLVELWNTEGAPARVDNDADPTLNRSLDVHPPARGSILRIVDFPPEDANDPISADRASEISSAVGLEVASSKHSSERHPFMHRTESVDYGIVLSGEITLILDDSETTLRAGNIVVQCGTIHAWANCSGGMCRMAFVLIDSKYNRSLAAQLGGVAAGIQDAVERE